MAQRRFPLIVSGIGCRNVRHRRVEDADHPKGLRVFSNLLVLPHQFPECPGADVATIPLVSPCAARSSRQPAAPKVRGRQAASNTRRIFSRVVASAIGGSAPRARSACNSATRATAERAALLQGRCSTPTVAVVISGRYDFRDKRGVGDWLDDFARNRFMVRSRSDDGFPVQLSSEPLLTVRCRQEVVDDGNRQHCLMTIAAPRAMLDWNTWAGLSICWTARNATVYPEENRRVGAISVRTQHTHRDPTRRMRLVAQIARLGTSQQARLKPVTRYSPPGGKRPFPGPAPA